jgi:hypothetical protein
MIVPVKNMTKLLLTLFFTVAMVSTATAKETSNEAQEATIHAESIAYVLTDKSTGIMKRFSNPSSAFVFYKSKAIDAIVKERGSLVPFSISYTCRTQDTELFCGKAYVASAGAYDFIVPKKGSAIETRGNGELRSYETESLIFNFEEGKHYTIDSRIDRKNKVVIDFSIKETESDAYLAYQEANPSRLRGTWSGLEKRRTTAISIDGEKMTLEVHVSRPRSRFIAEGRVYFNSNTIIFFLEKAVNNGKRVTNISYKSPYIWYYTLTDNVLSLEDCREFPFQYAALRMVVPVNKATLTRE